MRHPQYRSTCSNREVGSGSGRARLPGPPTSERSPGGNMPLKISPKAVSAVVVAILVLLLIASNWAGNPFDAKNITTFLVVGISLGGIYAILAGGLVVTYA